MELVLDSLSVILLGLATLLALVHLVLLRKPDPSVHPLLLGRQSELSKVRKERESPAFVSASAGLGGQAKQQLRGSTSVHAAIRGKGVSLVLGTGARQQSLDGRVGALAEILAAQGIDTDRELTVRLEDAADAYVTALAASTYSSKPPLLLSNPAAIASLPSLSSPVFISTPEVRLLPPPPTGSRDPAHVYLINSGAQASIHHAKFFPERWELQRKINLEDLPDIETIPEKTETGDSGDTFARMVTDGSSDKEPTVADVTHQNLLGGIVSILSLFPANERITSQDRILSFENASTPYGMSVAMAASSAGANLRLCTPSKGITMKKKNFAPSIIFCSPNELNAMRMSLRSALPKEGLLLPLAMAIKRSTLRAGSISKSTFWDRFIFSKFSTAVVGEDLRAIICSADEGNAPSNESLEYLRLVLGVPIVVVLTHPLVAGPVTTTMMHDLQQFASLGEYAHLGAPCAGIECKLVDVQEVDVKAGVYKGELVLRGPSVVKHASTLQGVQRIQSTPDGWLRTRVWTELRTNGTLRAVKAC